MNTMAFFISLSWRSDFLLRELYGVLFRVCIVYCSLLYGKKYLMCGDN